MPIIISSPEFGADNGRYPFGDDCLLTTQDGLEFPADAVLDAVLYYAPGVTSTLALREVVVEPGAVTFWIGSVTVRQLIRVGPFNPLAADERINAVFVYSGVDAANCGFLELDTDAVQEVAGWPVGTHIFSAGQAEFCATCVKPYAGTWVSGFWIGADEEYVSGEVHFVFEDGLVGQVEDAHLVYHAVGEPLYELREDPDRAAPSFLRTISEIEPDEYGAFNFVQVSAAVPDSILRIRQAGVSTVKFELVGPPE
jgi:hypothetical protein